VPDDEISMLNQLRKDGEISEEQYETLRRHVLWGTPLPELLEEEGITGPAAPPAAKPPAPADDFGHRRAGPPRKFTPVLPSHRPGAGGEQERPPQTGMQRAAFQPNLRQASRPAPQQRPAPPVPQAVPPPSVPQAAPPVLQPQQQFSPRPPQQLAPPPRPDSSLKMPLLAGAATLVVVIAALGVWWFGFRGDGSISPAKYAGNVCPDLNSWQRDIGALSGTMSASVNSTSGSTGKQTAAKTYFTNAATRTDQLVSALQSDGRPNKSPDFAKTLQGAVHDASSAFTSSAQQVSELETSASSFGNGLQVIIRDPQQPVDSVRQLLAKAPGPVRTALSKQNSCSGMNLPKP
jgi:hypothetical protein